MIGGLGSTSLLRRISSQGRPTRPPLRVVLLALVVAVAMLLPLIYLLLRASALPFDAWARLLRPRTLQVIGRSLLLAGSVTFSTILIAVPLAWLTARSDLPGRRMWMVAAALPLVIPSYVGGFALVAAFGPRGLLQRYLAAPLGIERLPDITGFPGAWLALTLFAYPYVLLTVHAALRRLDPDLEAAARALGDSPLRAFLRTTLPQLRPAIAAGGLLVALYVLSDFGAVSMLRYTTFTRAIYVQYTASLDRQTAAMLALMLVALTLILLGFEGRLRGRARGTAATPRPPRPARLRHWRWPALIYTGLVTLLAVGVPLLVIGTWFVIGLRTGDALARNWLGPAWRSVQASILAALAGPLVGLPLAFLVTRHPGRLSRLLERATYVGNALPGVVIGLALVFFTANFAAPLYQTLAVLVFGYLVRFLPEAVGALRAAYVQINPQVEDAARGLGSGRVGVLLRVTLPLLRPGLLAASALVFLSAMKELPATLLLAPTGYDTLATRIWSATAEAFYGRAAPPALLLLVVSSFSIGLILDRDRGEE